MTPPINPTLSHHFIAALEERRDGLYAAALHLLASAGDATGAGGATGAVASGKVESLLNAVVREAFSAAEQDPALDPWQAIEAALKTRNAPPSPPAEAMPADVWARLVAAIQVEAARSAHTRALNPDSVLLSPDPLLAPRKMTAPDDGDGFNLSPSSRFLLAAAIAVVIGIGLTIYLLTRPGPAPATRPASHIATTLPATAP